ncbi:MAG: HD domain-containing protein [Anaerolineae bacterium]|nr:HD domain-containing protein [Anaerolineae bacterium]
MIWNLNTLISLFATVAYAVLFFVVAIVKPHTKERKVFQYYLLMMLGWSLSAFMVRVSENYYLLWFRFMMATGFASVVVIFGFLQVVLNKRYQWAIWAYLYVVFTTILALFTDLVVHSIDIEMGQIVSYEWSPFVPILLSPAYILTFVNFAMVWRAYRQTKSHRIRNRYLYLLLAMFIIFMGSFINYTPLGKHAIDIAANFLAALIFVYAIMQYQLLDIRVVVRKGLLYVVPTTAISATYFLIITFALELFHHITGFQIFLLSLSVAVITGLVIRPFQQWAQRIIDRLFFREKFDFGVMLETLSAKTSSVLDLDQLTDIILDEITNTLHLDKAVFFLNQASTGDYVMINSRGMAEDTNLRLKSNHPVIAWLKENQQSLLTSDMSVMWQFKSMWGRERQDLEAVGAEIFVPVLAQEKLVGIFAAGAKRSEETYTNDDQRLLTTAANQTAVMIQNAQLYRNEQNHRAEMDSLYQLTRELVDKNEVQVILDITAKHAVDILHATYTRILMLGSDGYLRCEAGAHIRDTLNEIQIGMNESSEAQVFYLNAIQEGKSVILNRRESRIPLSIREQIFLDQAPSVLLAPLDISEDAAGLIVVGEDRSDVREPFDAEKIRLLNQVASQSASALKRARLHEELESTFVETVLALANTVDVRDRYTSDHSSRMAALATATCEELRCSKSIKQAVYWAAMLHDIGKIGVEDQILRKPAPLDSDEWDAMKRHPEIGANIIRPVRKLADVAPLVHAHHERFDGMGYPEGLKGRDIPLGARVLAVVDAFIAMTDDRVYRKGIHRDEAVQELRRCAGTHFDPKVVNAFLKVLDQSQQTLPRIHSNVVDLPGE